ncbi:hypothetical protein B0H14DRAFT_3439582 [Mycena olivaceomarginata]|nr:hypothetical protein B0H14DRAFT_3439582 [Mycena olivaceomarginata]
MPYSPPGVVVSPLPAPPTPPAGAHHHHHQHAPRPAHRRSYTFAADDPRAGPGAFASLGMLPRRTSSTAPPPHANSTSATTTTAPARRTSRPSPPMTTTTARRPRSSCASRPRSDSLPRPARTGRVPHGVPSAAPNSSYTHVPAALSPSALNVPVPFPRSHKNSNSPSSPISPTFASANGPNFPARPPGPARTASHPVILLSNGKPLKSSLKSSSSAPHVWTPGATPAPEGKPSFHLRARSAPSTPQLAGRRAGQSGERVGSGSAPTRCPPARPRPCTSPPPTPGWRTSGSSSAPRAPASVSFPLDDETETETETDSQQPRISAWGAQSHSPRQEAGYPFPKVAAPVGGTGRSPLNPERQQGAEGREWRYALDAPGGAKGCRRGAGRGEYGPCPRRVQVPGAGQVQPEREGELTLHGTLLARNAAFEKQLYVRFTLDGWCTTSEVGGRYVGPACSPFSAASPFCAKSASKEKESEGGGEEREREEPGPGWDRFAFSIRLTDYAHSAPAGRQHTHQHAQGLRERGVGGVGRGLEGRELVLVARFFAPWVRAGGVGPYAWCDTLPQHTPAQQAGTDVSPSGRAWVGAGGGGAGEWWDNNGGRDYRVGFRCVGVEPTPAPAPATNIIPFPRAASPALAPPSSTLAPSSASPAPSEAKPTTIPPPPPPRTAHAQALAAKLGRLSLRNYAAPGRAVSLPSAATAQVPAAVANEKEKEKEKQETVKEEKEEEKPAPAPGDAECGRGVGLYWPWGRAAVAAPPASASPVAVPAAAPAHTNGHAPAHDNDDSGSSSSDDEEEGLRDAEAGRARRASGFSAQGEGEETPPTSPLGAGGLLPALEEMGLSGGEEEKEKDKGGPADVPLPESPERGDVAFACPPGWECEPADDGAGADADAAARRDASSSLYKAFVRQWCFAGNGSGSGASGGVSPPVGAGAVLGGWCRWGALVMARCKREERTDGMTMTCGMVGRR